MAQLWVVAGPNGSGKTTVADRWFAGRIPVVSPDFIAASCGTTPIEAGKRALQQQECLISANASFAIDTTFSGKRELSLMQRTRGAGYKVNLVFVGGPDPDLCIARIAQRVADGGHWVPPEDVRRRHARSLRNFGLAFGVADRIFVLDNAGLRLRLLMSWENNRVRQKTTKWPQWALQAIPRPILDSCPCTGAAD